MVHVAICVPSGRSWCAETALAHGELRVFSAENGIKTTPISTQLSLPSLSRNAHVRAAFQIDPKPDFLLWQDSDQTFPRDALTRLLAHGKDIVGAFASSRVFPFETIGHLIDWQADFSKGGMHLADVMPGGMVLVRREVYETMGSPWYQESYDPLYITGGDPDGTVGEDVMFCRRAIACGFEIWCDLDLTFEIGHVGSVVVPCLRPGSGEPSMRPYAPEFKQKPGRPEPKQGGKIFMIGEQ